MLIRVKAASVNPLDWHAMRGEPFLARFESGLFKPKNSILGADIAGRVEAVGENVTQFKVGDEVYGDVMRGGFADYVCATESSLVLKPSSLSFEQAAAVPVAALTALQGLRNHGAIQAGQKVLINGASGGVGTFAVQIAKFFGTHVTAVCSTRNVELVRSLGADMVIDYTQEDFRQSAHSYDLMFDAVGNCSVADYKRALKHKGRAVVIGFTTFARMFQVMTLGSWRSFTSGQKIAPVLAKVKQADLQFMNELFETDKVTTVIDKSYAFTDIPEAITYLETSRARGKVVISFDAKAKA